MFSLDGRRTIISRAAQTILNNCGLPVSPATADAFAITLYRLDPVDKYPYLLAHAGIREPEVLFGPYNKDDFRTTRSRDDRHHSLGFKNREKTFSYKVFGNQNWQLFVNDRKRGFIQQYETQINRLTSEIELLLSDPQRTNSPLYPELWHQERLGRDSLRDRIRVLPPYASLDEVADALTRELGDQFKLWLGRNTK